MYLSKLVIYGARYRETTGHLICKIFRFHNFKEIISLQNLNRIVKQAIHVFFLYRSQVFNAKSTFVTLLIPRGGGGGGGWFKSTPPKVFPFPR